MLKNLLAERFHAMNPLDLESQLQKTLTASLKWSRGRSDISNALRSSHFCGGVGSILEKLASGPGETLHIGVADETGLRSAGEWMLDAVFVQRDKNQVVRSLQIAMECESSTAMSAFAWDFGKLLNVKAKSKIYLQGLNQSMPNAAEAFVQNRLAQASELVREVDAGTQWFFGFWPSPLKVRSAASLWDGLDGRYKHLRELRLFQFKGLEFVPVAA